MRTVQACKLDKPITPYFSRTGKGIYHWLEYTTISFAVFSFRSQFCGRQKGKDLARSGDITKANQLHLVLVLGLCFPMRGIEKGVL